MNIITILQRNIHTSSMYDCCMNNLGVMNIISCFVKTTIMINDHCDQEPLIRRKQVFVYHITRITREMASLFLLNMKCRHRHLLFTG